MDKKRIVGAKMEDGIIGKSVISRFRCVLVKQMQYFLPPNTYSYRENHALAVCKYLYKAKYATMDGDFLYSPGTPSLDYKMIDCIWAMIDILSPRKEEDIPLHEALKKSLPLDEPESLCFIQNNTNLIRAMAIETPAEMGLLNLEMTKLYPMNGAVVGEEYKIGCTLLIVIRDKNMLASIGNLNLKIPHKIAVLEGGMLEKPTISYYGSH